MILSFDTETTGLINYKAPLTHSSQPRIVQLGAMLFDDEEHLLGEINLLIKPAGWTIPAEAQAVHHISTEMCEKYGVPINVALGMFNTYIKLGGLIVAHNLDYDYRMISGEVARLGKEPILDAPAKFCTMKASTDIAKIPNGRGGFKWPKLQEVYRLFFGEDFADAHNAAADVKACARVFFELRRKGHAPV